jgi:hypothetical protein
MSLFLQNTIMLRISWKKFHSERFKKQEKSILELTVPQNMSTWEFIAPLRKLINVNSNLVQYLLQTDI